jgi:hypothetical protein
VARRASADEIFAPLCHKLMQYRVPAARESGFEESAIRVAEE